MSEEIDLQRSSEADVPEGPPKRSLQRLVSEVLKAQSEVSEAEEFLKLKKAALRELEENELPDAMASVGSTDLTLADGTKVKVAADVVGSFPKEEPQRQEALDYLTEVEGGYLFKTSVSVAFGKSEHNRALDLAGRLRDEGFEVEVSSGINYQSLCAFGREAIRSGNELELEKLGLMRLVRAKVTLPRGRLAFDAR